ncbi:MAG: hypothetical protein QM211_02445 [Bacillota bacterium]|jgi:hypothetical protein|nr:hypothetical protein [Bacillota bacterium]
MTKKQKLKYYVVLFIFVLIYWFIKLTPLNFHDKGFFIRLVILSILIILPLLISLPKKKTESSTDQKNPFDFKNIQDIQLKISSFKDIFKQTSGLIWIPLILLVLLLVFNLSSAKLFQSKKYSKLLTVEDGDFQGNIAEINFTDIPTVDKQTASRLGSKKMGEIAELVSQFEVDQDYVQINYQGRPVRVTPLRYGDIIKWFNNRSEGLPRLIRVDMIDSSVELQKLPSGMKYSNAEPLFRNIKRHLRFKYPFDIMDEPLMEVDDEGIPYWITPVLKPTVGWFGGLDVKEVILCNALTGEATKYKIGEIPTWIDRVYSANLILNHIDYYGKYQSGFFNSFIGQKGVLQATALYNYLAIDDDVYLYTGITSVSTEDNSNLGFVLVNLRTKQTNFYAIPSADESSAMRSAEGAVQEKGYTATVPILLNISGRPSYCMALKDQAQLVKMYALVDAQNYQTTGVGPSIKEAIQNYDISQSSRLINEPDSDEEKLIASSFQGKITDISSVTIDGNTYYYFMLESDKAETDHADQYYESQVFSAPVYLAAELAFLESGDQVKIDFLAPEITKENIENASDILGRKAIEISSIEIFD